MNILCHTKANSEIKPAIEDNKRIRDQTNAPKLRRLEGDGGQDSNAWLEVFKDELVTPTCPNLMSSYHQNLPRARLRAEKILKLRCPISVANWVGSVEAKLENRSSPLFYGLDTKQSCISNQTMVIQICLPSDIFDEVVVVDLPKIDAVCPTKFKNKLKRLKKFLENPILVPVAVQVSHDISALKDLGINLEGRTAVELMTLAKQYERDSSLRFGLQDLASRHLGLYVDKRFQSDQWNPVTQEHFQYAALDAFLHLLLYQTIKEASIEGQKSGRVPLDQSKKSRSAKLGANVVLITKNKAVAYGKLCFVGGSEGESMQFGGNTVGVGKSLVELNCVVSENGRPTASYQSDDMQWDHKKDTLAQVFGKYNKDGKLMMMWPSARVVVDVTSMSLQAHGSGDEDRTPPATQQGNQDLLNQDEYMDDADSSETDTKDADAHLPLSRNFYDRFHVFNSFPSSWKKKEKACLLLIRDLAMAAVTQFDAEDLSDVLKHLREKQKMTKWSSIVEDFIHNKEWWYRRVKMYPPTADQSVENVTVVIRLAQTDEELKEFWSDKLEHWFETLLTLCREGKLEEASDCVMFQEDGKDSNGLQLYIRRRGTSRSELLHQKMKVAFGPHGVGAEVGHFLLLLVTYKFNVSTGIKRLGRPDFGTFRLDIIDRIQRRYKQLFEVDFFPSHFNQTLEEEEGDYDPSVVSVGIRRLNYSSEYVQPGAPHHGLKGDLRFMAQRSGVVCVPLPIAHKNEIVMYNEFLMRHPKPAANDWNALARNYLEKCDYKTIFPKLPSMLRAHFSKWQLNSQIKSLKRSVNDSMKESMKNSYYELFGKFIGFNPKDLGPAAAFQKENCTTNNSVDELKALKETRLEQMLTTKSRVNPMPVPPAAAPTQESYVVSENRRLLDVEDGRLAQSCLGAFWGCNLLRSRCAYRMCDLPNCPAVRSSKKNQEMLKNDMKGVLALKSAWMAKKRSAANNEKRKAKRRKIIAASAPTDQKEGATTNANTSTQNKIIAATAEKEGATTNKKPSAVSFDVEMITTEVKPSAETIDKHTTTAAQTVEDNEAASSSVTLVAKTVDVDTVPMSTDTSTRLAEAIKFELQNKVEVGDCLDSLKPGSWVRALAINCWRRRLNILSEGCKFPKQSYMFSTYFLQNSATLMRLALLVPLTMTALPGFRIRYQERAIVLMDSKRGFISRGRRLQYAQDIREYLKEERCRKRGGSPIHWHLRPDENVPQQHNDNDCGVFTSMFVEQLLLQKDLEFQLQNVNEYRRNMIAFIIEAAGTNN